MQQFHVVAPLVDEDKHLARKGITDHARLNKATEPIETHAHIGMAIVQIIIE